MATEVKKTRPINRLQTMYALRAYQDEMYKRALDAEKEGRPTAWCMREQFAGPFLSAMGIESVYPENYGTVCAAAGTAPAFIDRSVAEGIPNYVCGYLQNCFGYTARMMVDLGGGIPPEATKGGMPKPMLLVATDEGCDTKTKSLQAHGRYTDAPVWMMVRPHSASDRECLTEGFYERYLNFFINHLREFVTFLERLRGKKFDWDKFEKEIDGTIEMDAVWYQVADELRKARPSPMNSRDFFSAMYASVFRVGDPQRVKELYRNMYDEVQYRIDNKIAGINREEKYRTSFQGLGPWHSMNIFDNIAERGWNSVWEGYHPDRPIELSWVKDPIERYVRFRYRKLADEIEANFEPEEADKVKEEIMQKGYSPKLSVVDARDYQLDGVILQAVLTCRTAGTGAVLSQTQLMKVWKVPSLLIVSDMTDPRSFDMDGFMKKAEAFEETMDHFRKVRKEEGLWW